MAPEVVVDRIIHATFKITPPKTKDLFKTIKNMLPKYGDRGTRQASWELVSVIIHRSNFYHAISTYWKSHFLKIIHIILFPTHVRSSQNSLVEEGSFALQVVVGTPDKSLFSLQDALTTNHSGPKVATWAHGNNADPRSFHPMVWSSKVSTWLHVSAYFPAHFRLALRIINRDET